MAYRLTHDNHVVFSGDEIWYVNYLHEIKQTVFKEKLKKSVVYFKEKDNAINFSERAICYIEDVNSPIRHMKDIINLANDGELNFK
jgi:hypothetical protein